jgi:diguanylate cyclase (GGDEF)-like protein/PAS domain S-box-containing protein
MDHTDTGGLTDQRRGNDALDDFLLAPGAILEGIPDAVVAIARDKRIVFVNALAEALFGYPQEELVGQPVEVLWPERVRERYSRNMDLYFATEHPLQFTTDAWGLRRNGTEFVGEMSWGTVMTTGGPLFLAIGRDVSERRAAHARLRAIAAIGERALTGPDPVDLAAEAVELLRTTLPITAEVRLAGGTPVVVPETTPPTIRLPIGTGDELIIVPERPLADEESSFLYAVANILGTALNRLRDEERTRYEAVHDPLTGLANRTLLLDRLSHALLRSEREGGSIGVLFIDLDNFKDVNDAHGHATGDRVLEELGARLQTAVRPGDTVARFGGDEFVVVCEEIDERTAVALGERLQRAIGVPLQIDGVHHRPTASIGIALGHSDPDTLLANADAAVYRAKGDGRARVVVYH